MTTVIHSELCQSACLNVNPTVVPKTGELILCMYVCKGFREEQKILSVEQLLQLTGQKIGKLAWQLDLVSSVITYSM